MNDEIDLEDLECRLYSQVYHSNIADEEINLQSELNLNLHVKDKAHNNRYFSKRVSDRSVFMPLQEGNNTNSEKIYSSIYNNISFNPTSTDITTEGNFPNQFQNNITVNQYTVPFILNTELSEVLNPNCANILVTRSIQNKRKLEKKIRRTQRKLERRRRYRERRNRNIASVKSTGNIKTKSDSIICITDESDGECVIVKDMCKKTQRKEKSSNALENSGYESENDIIYVPPPPVEIIDVDVDIEEDSRNANEVSENLILSPITANSPQTCSNELSNTPESCASNDFLDNSGLENNSSNFNFGLHGSDFNNAGDFLRPANPVEYCETESSCSTNDLNRENNSVKTVVFNEVDFPREDIFSDKNLEGFSSYITPKRNKKNKKLKDPSNSTCSENVSSPTSSESDYEPPDIVNKSVKGGDKDSLKKLPTLSPMQYDKVVASSKKLSKKKLETNSLKNDSNVTSHNIKKLSSKRKSNTLERTESDSDNHENQLIKKLPKKKKSKKRNSSEETEKNIQNKNSNTDTVVEVNVVHEKNVNNEEYSDSVNESIENNDTNRNKCKKKKKNKKHEGDSTTISNLIDTNSEKIKKKKRKSLSENILCDGSTGESNQPPLEQIYTGDANSRNNLLIVNDNLISDQRDIHSLQDAPDNISVSPEPTVDKIKRKKKKSVSENLVNNVNVNICETNVSSQITHADSENGVSISKDLSNHNVKKGTAIVVEIHEENTSVNLSTESISRHEVHEIEDISQNPCTSQRSSLFNELGEDIIVIDEVGPGDDDAEIIVSSGSESDFECLHDVGQDLELANCAVNHTPNPREIIDDDNSSTDFTSFYVKNKNFCKDYSKFDIEQIQSTQSDDPEAWKISPLDQFNILNCNRKKGPRCSRCRQFGHFAVRCIDKPYPPSCCLCGDPGHQEPRCPNKRCNQCGNKGDYSTTYCWKCVRFRNLICRLCNMNGHIANNCPDLWRRYHLTTEEGPIVESQHPQLKPSDQLWCSGCAGHGHLEHECNNYIRQYPPSNPSIISYKDVLHEADTNSRQNATPSPPPPPIITAPQQTNYLLPTPFPNFTSTSQNMAFAAPLFIPPLMSQLTNLNPVFPIPTILNQNQIVVPNHNINHNQNFTPASTRVLNPFSVYIQQEKNQNHTVLDRMMIDYVNDDSKGKMVGKHTTNELITNDQKRVRQIIMSMPAHVVFEFLSKEMADLENVVSHSDPRYLKKKLFKYDNILNRKKLNSNVIKEKCFWYRIINMFIFGVHKIKDGNLHINYIKRYLTEPKSNRMDANKRKSLLHAYNYIFDAHQRYYINYYKILQQLIRRHINRNE